MKKLIGYAGSGKTHQLSQDVKDLITKTNTSKILILTANKTKKDILSKLIDNENSEIETLDSFINNLYKKIPANYNNKKISDSTATYIIKTISKNRLKQNDKLKNLYKSSTFTRELYNLFTMFKVNKIDIEDLNKINANASITTQDKERFKIIINIYEDYCKTLKNNNLEDFRDIVFTCIENLQKHEIIKKIFKSKYEYLFMQGAEDLSEIEKELLTLIFDEDKIHLYADYNATTKGYMGANFGETNNAELKNTFRNQDILERALFILGEQVIFSDKSNSVKYIEYPDFQTEIEDIAQDIIKRVKEGSKYSDIAILIRNNSIKQNITDILSTYNIPVSSNIYNEDFEIYKYDFLKFLNLCEILEKLSIKNLDINSLEQATCKSKTDFEILTEKFNTIFHNILSELFENKFLLEKFILIQEQRNEKFLLNTILKNIHLLKENEKFVFNTAINLMNKLFNHYKNRNFVDFAIEISDKRNKTINYNKFLATFILKIKTLTEYSNLLGATVDNEEIRELIDFSLSENITEENKINLLTFFKCKGMEFKTVYIPALIEDYFPKKSQATNFISHESNEILSYEIQKKYKNFKSIIPNEKDELRDEEKLLYVAMTRAKENVILTTHNFDNTKNTQHSSFFEELELNDKENFSTFKPTTTKKKSLNKTIKTDINDKKIPQEFIIEPDDILDLSASAISNFLKCPKKYYYSKLLGLKEESSKSADYGTIVHAVFEVLLSPQHIKEFSKENTIRLGNILLNSKTEPEKAIELKFPQSVIEMIQNMDELTYEETKKNFYDAIKNLDLTGYFLEKPIKAECEKWFTCTIPQIPNVKFSGKIDAILTYKDSENLIDFKTSKDKKKLTDLISDKGVNFLSGKKNNLQFSPTKVKEYEYQIPLYYIACKNHEELSKYKFDKIGYQYIRPRYKNNGSKSDIIDTSEIEKYEDKIIENIQKYIIDEIRQKTEFEAVINKQNCDYCSYGEICSKNSAESDEGESNNE